MPPGDATDDGNIIATLHQALVDKLKATDAIQTEQVEAAFRAVPRHPFLPDVPLEMVYSDEAIPTKFQDDRPISSSSQPAIMAIMLEQLDLRPGQRVLEIGAGTGYNAALLATLVGATGRVTTVDLDEDIAASARENLAAAGFDQVNVICGDGMVGYAGDAPYDRIILTVGGWDIPSAWLEQLKAGGRILLPLSINGPQFSVAFDQANGYLTSASIRTCGFMRCRGNLAEPEVILPLGPEPGLLLAFIAQPHTQHPENTQHPPDAPILYQWLTGPSQDRPTQVKVGPQEIWRSLNLWLAMHEPQSCGLSAHGAALEQDLVPYLFGFDGAHKWRATNGVLAEAGLSVLMRSPDATAPLPETQEKEKSPPPFELYVRQFGPDETVAQRLLNSVQAWDKSGRPGLAGLRIRAYPAGADYTPTAKEHMVKKQWCSFVLDWPVEEAEMGDEQPL
jgi:protein-L-isoaspartate(D-aspartate) O-methyltransferase